MVNNHPEIAAFERLVRGQSTAEESGVIVSHLIAGCDRCKKVTRGAWRRAGGPAKGSPSGSAEPKVHPSSYSGMWRKVRRACRSHEELVAADRRRARRLCRELIALPASERLPLVCNDDRYRSLHLVHLLVETSLWRTLEAPRDAEEIAVVALAVARRVDPRPWGEATVRDLEAAAWSALGTAQRRTGVLDSAERSLRIAERLHREGSGDPLERARLLLLKAALRRDQHRFDEALALLRRAEASHGRLGDPALLGHIRIERGRVQARLGDLEDAVESVRLGLGELEPERDDGVAFDARIELAHRLLDLGRTAAAMQQLRALQNRELGDRRRLEVERLEGRIARARGSYPQAETMLRKAWCDGLQLGAGDAAIRTTLDLAALYLEEDPEKLRRLGQEIEGVLWPGVGLDAILSRDFLCWAAEEPGRHAGLIPCLSRHLELGRPSPW